jgi:hypothetical protein
MSVISISPTAGREQSAESLISPEVALELCCNAIRKRH